DSSAERARGELDCEQPRFVRAVEHGIDLDELERVQQPGLRDELRDEVRLAIREAPRHRGADAGRDHRDDDVDVDADVPDGGAREPAERPDRDRVVAAEHERQVAALARVVDERGDALARAFDRLEVTGARVADLGRLREPDADVAPVDADTPELLDPLLEPRVPDRRRAHVDTAPPGAQIEPGADHGDRPQRFLDCHFGKATSTWTRGRSTSSWRTMTKAS